MRAVVRLIKGIYYVNSELGAMNFSTEEMLEGFLDRQGYRSYKLIEE